ncbi:TPA: hypothetical protein ACX6QK_003908 [Photobacterium damselae]
MSSHKYRGKIETEILSYKKQQKGLERYKYLIKITRYSLLATRYSLLATRYSLLATRYSIP